jgi:hypothetical protein
MSDDMNITTGKDTDYRLFKTANSRQPLFINMADENSVKMARSQHNNENLHISVCSYNAPDPSAPRTYPLYFKIASNSSENVLKAALEICFYISDNFSIPQDFIEIIYTGGGNGMDAGAAGSAAPKAGDNSSTSDDIADNSGGSNKNTADTNNAVAEMVILIPQLVFAEQPTPLMLAINYKLARQLINDDIKNIDIDVYQRNYLIRLPNSFNSDTGSYVIPLIIKELMYLDASAILELAKQPRAEDSMIFPQKVPEAAEWFAEILKEFTHRKKAQDELLKLLLKGGWTIPPCIRRLLWADLSKEQALEACRVISQFYSWIKASPDEIWYHFQRIDRRNHIADYQRLRAILNFASENPSGFAGCDHKLLAGFCPSGKCFLYEIQNEINNPALFELKGE